MKKKTSHSENSLEPYVDYNKIENDYGTVDANDRKRQQDSSMMSKLIDDSKDKLKDISEIIKI